MFFNNWNKLKLKLHIWLKRRRRSHMTCNAPPLAAEFSNLIFVFALSTLSAVLFHFAEERVGILFAW